MGRKVKIKYGKNARFTLHKPLHIGYNAYRNRGSVICLDKGAQIIVKGNAKIFYGCDIHLFRNAKLTIGNSYINSNCYIRSKNGIFIGDDCAIADCFTALDSNFHRINGNYRSVPIVIENHVWIGSRVTILPGVTVGQGAVIAAGAVVTKSIPPGCLAAGIPAKVIKSDINWDM